MSTSRPSIGQLLCEPRFRPLFVTQFLGAFNDNLFKNAVVMSVTFQAAQSSQIPAEQLAALAGALFILPFFLFSALAGQLADKYSRTGMMRATKLLEVAAMTCGAAGLLSNYLPLLFVTLFLMGAQSSFFGPLKYAVLPDLLAPKRLVAGNALVETGTFLAILLGTISGGVLMALKAVGPTAVALGILVIALLGYLSSRQVPHIPAAAPGLRIERRLFRPTWKLLRDAKGQRSVFNSILGISWFWLMGAVVLSVLPVLVKHVLQGDETMVTYFLALFAVGVALGSLLCERLSLEKLELGLVPLGSIGLSIFLLDAGWALHTGFSSSPASAGQETVVGLLSSAAGLRLSIDFALFSIMGGVFTVPLYTLLQQRSPTQSRARMIAANNVLNALFMVVGSVLLMAAWALGASVTHILIGLALLNAAVAVYIYTLIPEFLFRLLCYVLAHALYRLRVVGGQHIPREGAAVLVCNHVTYIDWLIIASATARPIRFVMHHSFMRLPMTRRIFKDAKVIPIAGAQEDPAMLQRAFHRIQRELDDGQLVCIFPEGMLTRDGTINPFRRGIERIIATSPVPAIPMHLDGLWQSHFSRATKRGLFGKLWSRITLRIGAPVPPEQVSASNLQCSVEQLRAASKLGRSVEQPSAASKPPPSRARSDNLAFPPPSNRAPLLDNDHGGRF